MVRMTEKAARACLHLVRQGGILMIERGIGYWISPQDDMVPTPPRVSHADLMRALIDSAALDEDEREQFERDANAFAVDHGWTRVRIYPTDRVVYADLGQGKTRTHRQVLDTLLDQLGLLGYQIKYTDEQGNYVSNS
jgi:hypothetical protein